MTRFFKIVLKVRKTSLKLLPNKKQSPNVMKFFSKFGRLFRKKWKYYEKIFPFIFIFHILMKFCKNKMTHPSMEAAYIIFKNFLNPWYFMKWFSYGC